MHRLFIVVLLLFSFPVYTLGQGSIPHVSKKAQDSYQFDYSYASQHKAFAIAPGGAWSWVANKATADEAKQSALAACDSYTQQKCMLYALNNSVVFDKTKWSGLWGPYPTAEQAKKAQTGTRVGQKFPDVLYTDPEGKNKSISTLKGKIIFVHFWACWCPSCRYEFGSLINMYQILKDIAGEQVEFVMLQVREPIATSRNWAKANGVDALPLSDSGVKSTKDTELTLKGGKKIADRKLAQAFPASYVLDRNGVVLFSHKGSVEDWSEYVPFFMDAVNNTQ